MKPCSSFAGLVALSLLSVSASTASTSSTSSSCECGHSRNGVHYPAMLSVDFTKTQTVEAMQTAGLVVNTGWELGSRNEDDGTQAIGSADNIRAAGAEGIHLVVPGLDSGKQKLGGQVSAAEITFQGPDNASLTRAIATAEFSVTSVEGTCSSLFTFANDYPDVKDELDMEILSASVMEASSVADAGLQLTNHPSNISDDSSDYRIVPFPSDPRSAFHKYTIEWTGEAVQYYYDGAKLAGPTKNVANHPSSIIINHWSTGWVPFFGTSFPKEDAVMKLKTLEVYYATASADSLPSGCQEVDVCVA